MPQVGVLFGPPGRGHQKEGGDVLVWFQWWVRNKWTPPLWLSGLPAKLGEVLRCELRVIPPEHTQVRVLLKNETTGKSIGLQADSPDGNPVEGGTAEWIVERPCDPLAFDLNQQLSILPRFDEIRFEECAAQLGPATGGPAENVSLQNFCYCT
jgi:hypothetical protein